MKRLSKAESKEKAALVAALNVAKEKLEHAITNFNAAMLAAQAPVNAAVKEYNEAVDNAKGFCDDIYTALDSYFSERSDRWVESDAGQNYACWSSDWQDIGMDEIEVEFPMEMDTPELDHADNLEAISEEVDA